MSRIIGWIAAASDEPRHALGEDIVDGFAAQAAVHADGWGVALTRNGALTHRVGGQRGRENVSAVTDRADGGLMYLRFASAGTARSPENLQPFLLTRAAFAHNGALSPAERADGLLTPAERRLRRGDTDSEVYAILVQQRLWNGMSAPDALADAARVLREAFPAACLNAIALVDDLLVAVHSAGTVPPPYTAFSRRGWAEIELPEGHDEGYNVLRTATTAGGAHVVSTAGPVTAGWAPLPPDTVSALRTDGTVTTIQL